TATGPMPPALIRQLRSNPDFGVVAVSRVADAGRYKIGTAEPGVLGGSLAVEVREGTLTDLTSGTAALQVGLASALEVGVNDSVTIGPPESEHTVRVVALYDNSPVEAQALVSWSDFNAAGWAGAESLLLRRADGATAADAGAALDRALVAYPTL